MTSYEFYVFLHNTLSVLLVFLRDRSLRLCQWRTQSLVLEYVMWPRQAQDKTTRNPLKQNCEEVFFLSYNNLTCTSQEVTTGRVMIIRHTSQVSSFCQVFSPTCWARLKHADTTYNHKTYTSTILNFNNLISAYTRYISLNGVGVLETCLLALNSRDRLEWAQTCLLSRVCVCVKTWASTHVCSSVCLSRGDCVLVYVCASPQVR